VAGGQITNVLPDTGRFVMPLEAQLLEPDISSVCEGPPRMFPPIYFYEDQDAHMDPYEFAMETGRPVWVGCHALARALLYMLGPSPYLTCSGLYTPYPAHAYPVPIPWSPHRISTQHVCEARQSTMRGLGELVKTKQLESRCP
jgi:hypothetical protein